MNDEHNESHRVMFAYLAGLIKGEERERLTAFYECEHKTHARRYSNCAVCEIESIERSFDRSQFLMVKRSKIKLRLETNEKRKKTGE